MTYASGGLVQASDFNGFVNNINPVWAAGTGDSGYGQIQLQPFVTNGILFASGWRSVLQTVSEIAAHQGTTINTAYRDGDPQPGDITYFESVLNNNVTLITNNRLNAAAQGTSTQTTATSTSSWPNNMTMTFTVTFASAAQARYFFNGGGQLALNFAHPSGGGPIDATFRVLAGDVGTCYISSPVGTNTATIGVGPSATTYRGFTKIGGGGTTPVYNQTLGFYALTGSPQVLLNQQPSGGYYGAGSTIILSASYNGTTVVTITASWNDTSGQSPIAGSTGTVTVRPPLASGAFTNTWGSVGVTTSILYS